MVEARRAASASRPPQSSLLDNRPFLARAFVVLLCIWLLWPMLKYGDLSQDGLPVVVAGELLLDDETDQIYPPRAGGVYEVEPGFRARACESYPDAVECALYATAFVSTPASLPLAAAVGAAGRDLGVLLVRVLAAVALAVGMAGLWRALADSHPRAPAALATLALLVTPLALLTISVGQTSPFLFAAAVLGPPAFSRSATGIAGAAAWVLATAFKGFPGLAGLVLLRRRWRDLAAAVACLGALVAIAIALGGTDVVGEFLDGTRGVADETVVNTYNASFEGILGRALDLSVGGATAVAWACRAALAPVVVAAWRRLPHPRDRWALACWCAVAASPQLWYHYLWVAIALVVLVGRGRPAVLLAVGVVAVPLAADTDWRSGLVLATLVASVCAVAVLAARAVEPAEPAEANARSL